MKTQVKQNRFLQVLSKCKNWLVNAVDQHPFYSCLVSGLIMNILIYFLHARSPIRGLLLIVSEPLFFLYNALIIIAFYCISLFFARRLFFMSFITFVWFALGVTECVLLGMRITPLSAIDFYIVRTGIAIVHVYMSPFEIALTIFGLVAVISLLVFLFIKCPKSHPDYVRSLLIMICCLLLVLLLTFSIFSIAGISPKNYDVMADAYDAYGFPFCFLCSLFDRGIPEPDNYSEEQLNEILTDLAHEPTEAPEKLPNIVMVQLESFFDATRVKGTSFSDDPIPNFHALGDEGARGLLSVPDIGSGTANTEFEVLSGLNLDFFGVGEYPYTTILHDRCCETIAYNLADLGYATHSMHNHTGTFYDRYHVYSHLGFDTFTPVEHMNGVEYTELNWEKDAILTEYILKALNSTDSQDFVFAVSVQGHGKYPEVPMEEENRIQVGGFETEEMKNAFEYYVNQIHEMDLFVGALRDALLELDEDTVLVLYGDHLPAIDLAEDDMRIGSPLQTDYIVWSNFPMEHTDADLEAYQLSPTLLQALGIHAGLVNKVHHRFADTDEYQNVLQLIGYDMLYGDQFAYGEAFPYEETELTLGLDPIGITSITPSEDKCYTVSGHGFTPFSHIFVNGSKKGTEYVSDTELRLLDQELEPDDSITVVQISVDLQKLSQTEAFVMTATAP